MLAAGRRSRDRPDRPAGRARAGGAPGQLRGGRRLLRLPHRRARRGRPGGGAAVSFQVDHIDEFLGRGWSVLAIGPAHYVDDPVELERLAGLPGAAPWAGGRRPRWVRIRPEEISGRQLVSG
ncbi:pyridoxamine 5'-phosphate oxidase family protein [Kitasatospora sp. NPDC092039]|uniref:pyridoxamine 5'-phosphate oxidase family protein n=1 Tax=Kitasatospora sp. NPDC092039 TaxID=3364086 RepID=UPI00381F1A39